MKDDRKIIGYCAYDKSPIYENDDCIVHEGEMYHKENFKQMNTFYDPLGDLDND